MEKNAKSIWKENNRKNRIKERENKESERENNERQLKLENEIFEKEYLVKCDISSTKIQKIASRNLLLLVIPIIICVNYLLKVNSIWIDKAVIILMAYQWTLVVNFIICIFKSPENYRIFNRFHMHRVERNYFILSLPIFLISCSQIYLYFKEKVLIASLLNVILLCTFTFLLVLYSSSISPQKNN